MFVLSASNCPEGDLLPCFPLGDRSPLTPALARQQQRTHLLLALQHSSGPQGQWLQSAHQGSGVGNAERGVGAVHDSVLRPGPSPP